MGSHRKPIPVEILARITKFYVSNLPERCSGADLAKEIRNFGNIFDIYVARKRDKVGRRFAFVSLLDVKDRGEMEKVLSAIQLGDYKIKVNVARFVLEEGEVNERKSFFNQIKGERLSKAIETKVIIGMEPRTLSIRMFCPSKKRSLGLRMEEQLRLMNL